MELRPEGIAPPISSDPPFHHDARRLLLPAFAPQAIAKLEPCTRAYCDELLDALAGQRRGRRRRRVRPAHPGAGHRRHARLPEEDADQFRGFVHDVLEGVDAAARGAHRRAFRPVRATSTTRSQDHIANPRDDLTSYLLDAEMDGEPLDAEPRRAAPSACC